MSAPDLTKLHRSELEAIVVDQAKTAERFRRSITNIVRAFEDEGDRVYLGSSNDADELIELDSNLSDHVNWLECPWMHGRDLYADLRSLRADNVEPREALAVFSHALGDIADTDVARWPDNETIEHSGAAEEITWGDLRRARSVIAERSPAPPAEGGGL